MSTAAPGRPREIESPSNLWLIHPVARTLATVLARTPVTPNQVSMASVVAAGAGAAGYIALTWPLNALVGLVGQYVWHVLDGTDGDLARRTGRASPRGELIDGVCDHVSQALLYLAFGFALQRSLGPGAWTLAAAAAASHFLQANAYESGRKTYRRWVYGAAWMRQTGGVAAGPGAWLGAVYLAVSRTMSPGDAALEAAMSARAANPDTRSAYRAAFAPLVKASGLLSSNTRTAAAFVSILIGSPLWFFLFELTALNLALIALLVLRRRANLALARSLAQAATAPN